MNQVVLALFNCSQLRVAHVDHKDEEVHYVILAHVEAKQSKAKRDNLVRTAAVN